MKSVILFVRFELVTNCDQLNRMSVKHGFMLVFIEKKSIYFVEGWY